MAYTQSLDGERKQYFFIIGLFTFVLNMIPFTFQ